MSDSALAVWGTSMSEKGGRANFDLNSGSRIADPPGHAQQSHEGSCGLPGADRGTRTPTGVAPQQILSLVRLPIPPCRPEKGIAGNGSDEQQSHRAWFCHQSECYYARIFINGKGVWMSA